MPAWKKYAVLRLLLPGQWLANLPSSVVIAHGVFFIVSGITWNNFFFFHFVLPCFQTVSLRNLANDPIWASQEALMNYSTKKTKQSQAKKTTYHWPGHMNKEILKDLHVRDHRSKGVTFWQTLPATQRMRMGLVGCLAHVFILFLLLFHTLTLRCLKRNRHDVYVYTWMLEKLGFS